MADKPQKQARDFGRKEKILNYASHAYQLTRPSKVDAVMALIRACQPRTFEEWEAFYFENAYSKSKNPTKVTRETLDGLGERLYKKITEVVIPEWTAAWQELTEEDCKAYIYQLTITRTYDGFLLEKSVINDGLAKTFPEVRFEESSPRWDHACNIDYLGRVGEKAFGIQIKPVTANANFGNCNIKERMRVGFQAFEEAYGGKVFVVFSTCQKQNKKKASQIRMSWRISKKKSRD